MRTKSRRLSRADQARRLQQRVYEIDPDPKSVPEDDRWWIFKEDTLQMKQPQFDRLLDVGWYPEGDLDGGSYGLVVYQGDFTGELFRECETRDRAALVAEIERVRAVVSEGRL